MKFQEAIILHGIRQMGGERSNSGLYHILSGKKTSQVIQDGKLFSLSNLFGTMPNITYSSYMKIVRSFFQEGLVVHRTVDHPMISEVGEERLVAFWETHDLPQYLDGWRFGDMGKVFWRRFTLFVQTLSHLRIGDRHFHPIQNDPTILSWVREHFPFEDIAQTRANEMLYQELHLFLQETEPIDAEIVLYRMTRRGRIGKTTKQIADHLSLDPMECEFRFQGTIHRLLSQLVDDPEGAPGLYTFIRDMDRPYTLTESTRKTYTLLKRGLPLDEIVTIRGLKMTTIEDHLVEIAIHVPDFSIGPYLSLEAQQDIHRTAVQLNTKKLKTIREAVGNRFSYFQIRLALARWNEHPIERREGEADVLT